MYVFTKYFSCFIFQCCNLDFIFQGGDLIKDNCVTLLPTYFEQAALRIINKHERSQGNLQFNLFQLIPRNYRKKLSTKKENLVNHIVNYLNKDKNVLK